MNRKLFSLAMVICTVALLVGAQTVNAELIEKDSADFTWCYEMDVDPVGQNLDGNGVMDWTLGKGSTTFSGGYMTMGVDPNDSTRYTQMRSNRIDGSGSDMIWDNISDSTGFTVELSVKTAGTYSWQSTGTGGLYLTTVDNTSDKMGSLVILNEGTLWDATSKTQIDSNANNDDFHIFRIAQEADGTAYHIWRDGELLHTGNGSTGPSSIMYLIFGDQNGARGPNVVDYLRLTTGAFAPVAVPEPSTLALLSCGLIGLLAYAWRKRR